MDRIPPPSRSSGLATASLVCGILSLCAWVLGFVAVVFGHVALSKIKKDPVLSGGGMAIAGLIMGYIGVTFAVVYGIILAIGFRIEFAERKSAQELFLFEEIALPEFPDLGEGKEVGTSGVIQYFLETKGAEPGHSMTFRVYVPPGQHAAATLPCVIVAPAGSDLLSGLALDDSDYHDETLPYAEAGMVVVNYSLDGVVLGESDEEVTRSYEEFRSAGAGLVNARNAIELVRRNLPMVDQGRVFSAGHSSAGTLSLLNAAHFPELAGATSYAPAINLRSHFADLLGNFFVDLVYPELWNFTKKFSPGTHASKVEVPVFLFYARDDSMVDLEEGRTFRFAVEDAGGEVTFSTVPSGGHYQSMIDRGIPEAIKWIQEQDSAQ
ncbi:MAG: DUF4190 domain-containing protein [Verrucomicrobiota bacterium]